MPWRHASYKDTIQAYVDVLGEHLENQSVNVRLKIREMLTWEEIHKHDFTKRQLCILDFIMTYSFSLGKPWAVIPKLQDFELAGISRTKIKEEITKLVKMNVVEWNRPFHRFRLTEPNLWKCPYNFGYNEYRARELMFLNIRDAGVDTRPIERRLEEMLKS